MDKELLEVVLKKSVRDGKVEKVTEVDAISAVRKGENYSSKILRLKAKVVLGNGRTANRSFILKQVFNLMQEGMGFNWNRVVAVEAEIYSKVHKEMTYLMEEFEDSSDKPWCNFIHCDVASSIILLEDLKPLGYTVVPRQKGLNLEHAQLALEALGRFHGMAKVLEERGIVSKDDYDPYFIMSNEMLVKSMVYSGFKHTAQVMKDSWDPCWKETAEKLLSVTYEKFVDRIMTLSKPEPTVFTVLNHGDCWSNNMMFKYDWSNRPISVKLLDYQIPHYNTPCIDVIYFLHLSVQPVVRRQNYLLLVQTYYDSLVRTLDKFKYSGEKPSHDSIKATMDRLSFFGLAMFLSCYANVTCSSEEAFNVTKLLESEGREGYNPEVLKEPGMVEKMGPDIIDFVEKHLQSM